MIKNMCSALRIGMWIDKRGWCHFMPDWYTRRLWRKLP